VQFVLRPATRFDGRSPPSHENPFTAGRFGLQQNRQSEARKTADRLACQAWNKRMFGFQGPAQPSALGDALNAGYLYLEVKCLGCSTHQTVPLRLRQSMN
jgi:hypothetical protein